MKSLIVKLQERETTSGKLVNCKWLGDKPVNTRPDSTSGLEREATARHDYSPADHQALGYLLGYLEREEYDN